MKIYNHIPILFWVLMVSPAAYAQVDQNTPVVIDTVELDADKTINNSTTLPKEIWEPDPKKALWMSMAVPGLGQIYNRSWWKTPLIYGGLGVSIWFISDNSTNYKRFREAYSESFKPDTENILVKQYPNQESLRRIRDIYYKRYQLSIIVTAAVYLMNGLEAYVDAHLKNFEISDDLSLSHGLRERRPAFYTSSPYSPKSIPIIGISYTLH